MLGVSWQSWVELSYVSWLIYLLVGLFVVCRLVGLYNIGRVYSPGGDPLIFHFRKAGDTNN